MPISKTPFIHEKTFIELPGFSAFPASNSPDFRHGADFISFENRVLRELRLVIFGCG